MKLDHEVVLREILEQSLGGYWDWDIQSGNEYMSPAFKKMFGYDDHELPNRADTWQRLIFPEDLPGVLKTFEDHVASKGSVPYHNEVRYRHKNGSTVWVICTGKVIEWDDNGRPVRMVGCHVDITKRKITEEALVESEGRYRQILHTAMDGLWRVGPTGRFIEVNKAWSEQSGYTVEEACRMFVSDVEVNESSVDVANHMERLARRGTDRFETIHRRKDGSLGKVEVSATYFSSRDGEYFAFLRDITASSDAKRALLESELLFRTLASFAPVGIYITDSRGQCQYTNQRWGEMAGLTFEEALGDGWTRGLHPDDRQSVFENWERMISSRGRWGMEYRFQTKAGIVSWVYGLATPLLDESGSITRYLGINLDITDRKRTEEVLRRNQNLESLGILAGGIAHDFNNLLGGIFGNIDLASEEADAKKRSLYLGRALSAMDRARALSGQLLTFAKGGAPIKKLDRLAPFIEETARFALSGSNVACRCAIRDDLWPCEFDRNQIGQVIDNIVINAQQAMPSGGIVEITAENIQLREGSQTTLAAGDYVKVSIRDHGIGMPKEILPRIFDPFYTTKAKGHGLGLATCYSIISRHGGYIGAESEPGVGSTFVFFLPASAAGRATEGEFASATHRGCGSILIMDDEETIRDALSTMLESMGYAVCCAFDSSAAIGRFRKEKEEKTGFAAVILDLTIPGGPGGKETIREIREIDANVPAFVASGYARRSRDVESNGIRFRWQHLQAFQEIRARRIAEQTHDSSEIAALAPRSASKGSGRARTSKRGWRSSRSTSRSTWAARVSSASGAPSRSPSRARPWWSMVRLSAACPKPRPRASGAVRNRFEPWRMTPNRA